MCFLFLWLSSYCTPNFSGYTGTHLSNTREAKAFALLSEEGIAKGVRRITAVTLDSAFKAMELACSLDQEISDTSKADISLLEKVAAKTPIISRLSVYALHNNLECL